MVAQLLAIFHAFFQPTSPPTVSPPLVDATTLARELEEPGLVLLDTRTIQEYDRGHLPGAVWVDVKAWQAQGRKPGGFRDAEGWAKLAGAAGIGNASRVVVYGNQLPETARIWWLLRYLGLGKTAILDGGWQYWVQSGGPVTRDSKKPVFRPFKPDFQADRLEEIEPLKASVRQGKARVVDARTADEFSGKDVRGPRGGHIPGSTHLEWKELVAKDGRFLSPAELKALFAKKGLDPEETLITC